ncbi:MAG: hypothetical protein HYT22_02665 [Candidatus Niyogibacteria bacterium]|nr:hypothetical protein [Candidatus Niyogibacteria bacterium]
MPDFTIIDESQITVKGARGGWKRDFVIVFCIILVAVIAFGLGRLSVLWEEKMPVQIETISR